MNIETNTGIQVNKQISFRNMMILIVVLISFCVQGIYLVYNGYKFHTFSNELLTDGTNLAHQSMVENVEDVVEQVENLFTFAKWYNLAGYVDANLNLRDEQYVSDVLAQIERSYIQADIKPDIIESCLLVGKNQNQKSLYYGVSNQELTESPAFCQEVLEETGILTEIYKGIGIPVRLPTETLEAILEQYDKTSPVYPELKQFVEKCSKHHIVMDVISNVMMITFLDESCFSIDLDQQGEYGYALLSSDLQVIYSQGESVQPYIRKEDGRSVWKKNLEGEIVRESKVWPEELLVVTVCKNDKGYLSRYITLPLVGCMLLLNLIAFALVLRSSKKLLKPLKLFEHVMTREKEKDTSDSTTEKSATFGKQLFFSLFVSCIIPFLCMNLISNRVMNAYGNRLLKQYIDTYVTCYEEGIKRLQSDCEQISTDFAVEFIRQYDINSNSQRTGLIQQFEKDIHSKASTFPTCSYVLVTDRNYHILHQSEYSGRTELFMGVVGKVATATKASYKEKQFCMIEDTALGETVLAFYTPVMKGDEFVGSMIFALNEQTLPTYMGATQEYSNYVLVDKSGETFGNAKYANVINTTVEKIYKNKEFWIAPCTQNVFKDTSLYVGVNVESYTAILSSILFDSVIIGLILAIVIVLISIFMMRLMLTPIVGMSKKFSVAGEVPQRWEINTGVTEMNELILVYNTMVKRQEQLLEENEKRHENEKNLVELRSQAEFKMLQQQINPHFMFNTLEVINMLAAVNHLNNISDVARALAEILRFSLKSTQTVTVGEEIAALQNYLLIQNIRFGDRIQFHTEFDEKLMEYEMLKFLLQPLVENAISHGVYNKLRGGIITVSVGMQKDSLCFCVSDNGVGMQPEQLEKLRESLNNDEEEYGYSTVGGGIGLKNIYRRLRYYYGCDADMLIESEHGNGTSIKLILPKRTNEI